MTVAEVVTVVPAAPVAETILPEHIDEVRKHVDAEYQDQCDDETIKRFIRATSGHVHLGGHLHLAEKRLQATCAWRKEVKPEAVVCKACIKDPRSHYMHLAGFDKQSRPIIYSCIGLASNKTYEDNKEHMISTFETAVKCMPPPVDQWVWVSDFHGFGLRDVNVTLAKLFLEVSANHYPERLGLFLVVGAPKVFNLLWAAIEALVDRKTRNKIRFVPYDVGASSKKGHVGKLEAEMAQHFDAPTTEWLLQEMAQNRDRGVAADKVYCMQAVHALARKQALVGGAESAAAHNCHGCTSLLARYEADPSLLEPQATAVA